LLDILQHFFYWTHHRISKASASCLKVASDVAWFKDVTPLGMDLPPVDPVLTGAPGFSPAEKTFISNRPLLLFKTSVANSRKRLTPGSRGRVMRRSPGRRARPRNPPSLSLTFVDRLPMI
jgi:hypothetical protein